MEATAGRRRLPSVAAMTIPRTRRMLAGTLMLALAPSAALLAGAPSASAAKPVAHAAAASSRFASLASIAVAPHSSTAFAFGRHGNATTSTPYALRRSGGHWSTLKVANPASSSESAIAAGSSSKAWLVGTSFATDQQVPFIETLKGSRFVPTKTKLGTGTLVAAAASSAKNVWAVGDNATGAAIAAHFNGKKWSLVAVPAGLSELTAVSTTGAKNVWAVTSVNAVPSSAHFNGKKWSVTPIAAQGVNVTGIATTGSSKVVAVGYHFVVKGNTEFPHPLTFRLSGKKWKSAAAPFSLRGAFLEGVTALGTHGYAVGLNIPANQLNSTPLVLRLSHGKWKSEKVAKRGHASALVSVGMSSKLAAAAGQWAVHPQCTLNATPPHPFIVTPHGSTWGQVAAPEAITMSSRRC
jgi:hypothetical protein